MINEKEIQISNKSYTNKQFSTIYPELIDLSKKLGDKWDAENTNESDPAIVLTKLMAFIADKNNYNIDKNVLENFMPSCTQESSMRALCEANGYSMKYYRSAETTVVVSYTKTLGDNESITLQRYTTTFKGTDDSSPTFTLLDDITFTHDSTTASSKRVIQGVVKRFKISTDDSESSKIGLTALDDENRLFFNETNVAENGIFITTSSGNEPWKRVDSLNTHLSNERVFQFGFDSASNRPFIKFSDSISSIIGDGLTIYYTITDGVRGNISANELTSISNNSKFDIENSNDTASVENFYVTNPTSTNNGADKETIDEAYNSYKKTTCTFDTLVTCRDYANYIYNMQNDKSNYLVSNCQVADRRNDVNYNTPVVTFDLFNGQYVKNFAKRIVYTDNALATMDITITPFDLCLYPLNTIDVSYTREAYLNSFRPLLGTDLTVIRNELENDESVKSISHNYKNIDENAIYCIKNYYTLYAKIATHSKVNKTEQEDIIRNVYSALYKNFNARKVDYGYDIPYDELLEVIENADSRIKNVNLAEPDILTRARPLSLDSARQDETLNIEELEPRFDYPETGVWNAFTDVLVKNILAGKIPLFEKDNSFDFKYGQSQIQIVKQKGEATLSPVTVPVIKDIESMTTKFELPKASLVSATGYKLKKNEIIKFITNSYATDKQLSYGVLYYLKSDNLGANQTKTIARGTTYKLGAGEHLYYSYQDENEKRIHTEFGADTIIRPNGFDLVFNNTATANSAINIPLTSTKYYALGAKETIDELEEVTTSLKSSGNNQSLPMYWIMRNRDNSLVTSEDKTDATTFTHILEEDEYVVYSSELFDTLVVLGSGTKIVVTKANADTPDNAIIEELTIDRDELLTITSISENGLSAFSDKNWRYPNSSISSINVSEMTMFTFGEGTTIKSSATINDDTSTTVIGNNYVPVKNGVTISYKNEGETSFTALPSINVDNVMWQVKTRLDIDTTTEPQKILDNQSVTLKVHTDDDTNVRYIIENVGDTPSLQFNAPMSKIGGENIDMSVTDITTGKRTYNVSAFNYKQRDTDIDDSSLTLKPTSSGSKFERIKDWHRLNLDRFTTPSGKNIPLTFVTGINATGGYILEMYASADNIAKVKVTTTVSGSSHAQQITLKSGLNHIILDATPTPTVELDITSNTGIILIHDYFVFTGFSKELMAGRETAPAILTALYNKLRDYTSPNELLKNFYVLNSIDKSKVIDVDSVTSSEYILDKNNIANRITIPEIDIDNSNISILKSSKI